MSTPMIRTVIALPALLMLAGAAKPVVPMVVRGDGLMDLVVGGKAARIRITPWAPAAPTLNPDFAQSIGLKGGLFGFAVKVGPVKVGGKTGVTRFDFGTMTFRRRVVWFDRRYEAQGDGAADAAHANDADGAARDMPAQKLGGVPARPVAGNPRRACRLRCAAG